MTKNDVKILSMRDPLPEGYLEVNCTSRAKDWGKGLSPFKLGPIPLYWDKEAALMENAWQFAKVYQAHVDEHGLPTQAYWDWAKEGWADTRAHRYPMGKGAKPLYSLWAGKMLPYIEARKVIYSPLYSRAVRKTEAFKALVEACEKGPVAIRDFDGYDHDALGMSLDEVVDCESKKQGHAFVLKMMLLGRDDLTGEFNGQEADGNS